MEAIDKVPRGKKWMEEWICKALWAPRGLWSNLIHCLWTNAFILAHLSLSDGKRITNLMGVLLSPSLWVLSYGLSDLSGQHFINLTQGIWLNLGLRHISLGPLKKPRLWLPATFLASSNLKFFHCYEVSLLRYLWLGSSPMFRCWIQSRRALTVESQCTFLASPPLLVFCSCPNQVP